jgi:RecA/RadA recombinase
MYGRGVAAFAVALIALFVALGGTAGASEQKAVPLAKHALVADNAKKLGGQTAAQIIAKGAAAGAALSAQTAGPASTAASLVTIKTGTVQIAASALNGADVACDSGSKVVGGGMTTDGAVVVTDTYPKNDTTWSAGGVNLGSSTANATVYAVCLK